MARIVVAHSFFLRFDAKQWAKQKPYPPLATLYVANAFRTAGHEVRVFDAMLAEDEAEFAALVEESSPEVVVLFEDNFNFLSKMCLSRMRTAALTMASFASSSGATVIASGSDASDHPGAYLGHGVDYVAFGEGDHTVAELVALLVGGAGETAQSPEARFRPDDIAGVAWLDASGDVQRSTARRNERHPDVFGRPARDLIDLEPYRSRWRAAHGRFSLNMASTRGCPFHCNWCAKPIWGQRYAMRTPADVAAELSELKALAAPDHVWFADDIFGLRAPWVAAFADEVERVGAAIPFTIQSRCDLMTEQSVAGLRRAGCEEVWLGAESGSQVVLDAMDKGTTVEEISLARKLLGAAGIRACFFIQFGYPGEQWDDIMATVEMVRACLPDDIGISVSYPLPGTGFHRMVVDQLGDKTHWDDSGDLAMMFRGTYGTGFYRHLHTTLHDDLEFHRRLAGLGPSGSKVDVPVSLPEHEERVTQRWAELKRLAKTERNSRPTILVRSEPAPIAPDLSRSHN